MSDTKELSSFDKVVEIAKKVKLDWVENTERGDMPPTVFVERGGKCVAIVMAPQVDRDAGLKAAAACRAGFRADALMMVMDAHVRMERVAEELKDKIKTTDDLRENSEFLKNYKHGDMQRACDQEGACERGEIADCLICHRIDEKLEKKLSILPYSYHGKEGGVPFKWLVDHPAAEAYSKLESGEEKAGIMDGYIVDALVQIMQIPAIIDRKDEEILNTLKKAAQDNEIDEERQLYHTGRAILRMLQDEGYQCLDLQPHPDKGEPEPLPPRSPAVSLRDLIPEDVEPQIGKLIGDRGGEPTFEAELLELLKPHQQAINANAEKLGLDLEHVQVEEIAKGIAKSFQGGKKGRKKRPEPPYKVKVWNGDQSEYLGEGTYVGDVPVYFVAMPDGSIRSLSNAEEKPSDEVLAEMGGELIEAGNNPKIVLDKESEPGRNVVYGCQVWWDILEEGDSHEHHEGCGCGHDH